MLDRQELITLEDKKFVFIPKTDVKSGESGKETRCSPKVKDMYKPDVDTS